MTEVAFKHDPKVAAIHSLRINVKSLAAEARFIRKEEKRCGPSYRSSLSFHRILNVRQEAMHAQLALAFLKGRQYRAVEQKAFSNPSAIRISKKLIKHFGDLVEVGQKAVEKWLTVEQ